MAKKVKKSACSAGNPGSIPEGGRSPEEGNGNPTPSSILAWKIPWTEEPGGLQSMGLQRVRHNWATITFTLQTDKNGYDLLMAFLWDTSVSLLFYFLYISSPFLISLNYQQFTSRLYFCQIKWNFFSPCLISQNSKFLLSVSFSWQYNDLHKFNKAMSFL